MDEDGTDDDDVVVGGTYHPFEFLYKENDDDDGLYVGTKIHKNNVNNDVVMVGFDAAYEAAAVM